MPMPRPKMRLLLQRVRAFVQKKHDEVVENYCIDELGTIVCPEGIAERDEAQEHITNLDNILQELQS